MVTTRALTSPQNETAPHAMIDALGRATMLRTLDRRALADLACRARWRSYARGASIAPDSDAMAVVVSGGLRETRSTPEGRTVLLNDHEAGATFLLRGRDARGGRASALTALVQGTTVCLLAWSVLRRAMLAHPGLAVAALEELQRDHDAALDRVEDLALYPLDVRLARLLLHLVADVPDQRVARSQEDLAWVVGASREEVGKMLRSFRESGLIRAAPRTQGFTVVPAALARHARLDE